MPTFLFLSLDPGGKKAKSKHDRLIWIRALIEFCSKEIWYVYGAEYGNLTAKVQVVYTARNPMAIDPRAPVH